MALNGHGVNLNLKPMGEGREEEGRAMILNPASSPRCNNLEVSVTQLGLVQEMWGREGQGKGKRKTMTLYHTSFPRQYLQMYLC